MYFAVWGKNIELSKLEISLIWENIKEENWIIFFDTKFEDRLKFIAWSMKIWHIVSLDEFINMYKKLVWSNIHFDVKDKKKYNIKRYKQVDLQKSDLEIKKKWLEVIFFKWKNDIVWLVDYYQDISMYEIIDFSKPVRSMQVGMMPTKLTHLLVNLSTSLDKNKTIYDPFVWTWTTMMVWNYLWNNTIWSDLNPTICKQNWKFYEKTELYSKEYKSIIFKQDITKPIKNKVVNYATNIVSEWFLWPIVGKYMNEKEAINLERSFQNVYIDWILNLLTLENVENIVITFPVYFLYDKTKHFFYDTYDKLRKKWVELEYFDDIYHRKWQKVWRQIVKIKKIV